MRVLSASEIRIGCYSIARSPRIDFVGLDVAAGALCLCLARIDQPKSKKLYTQRSNRLSITHKVASLTARCIDRRLTVFVEVVACTEANFLMPVPRRQAPATS